MIKVFRKDNLAEVLDKKPIILYRSMDGACGPSGLFFVVFSDRSCYAYSTRYTKSDETLIESIKEYVPEFVQLLGSKKKIKYKREPNRDLHEIYLGLGNYVLILEDYFSDEDRKKGYSFPLFKQIVKESIDEDITSIYHLVEKEING